MSGSGVFVCQSAAPCHGPFFFVDKTIYVLPPEEEIFVRYEAKARDSMLERLKILKALRTGEDCLVVAPVSGAIRKLPPHEDFEEKVLRLAGGEEIELNQVKEKLAAMGYERVSLVDARGQFSIRGSIIDVFTADGEAPCRIELFDTEIDSIRSFDPDTQRSIENLSCIDIYPAEPIVRDKEILEKAAGKIRRAYGAQIRKFSGEDLTSEEQERGEILKKSGGTSWLSSQKTESTSSRWKIICTIFMKPPNISGII